MSLRWAILGSGSKANAYLFQTAETSLAIDAGYPLRTFRKRAVRAGLDPSRVQILFLTHTHGDHVKGLSPVLVDTGATLVHRAGLRRKAFLDLEPQSVVEVESQTSYSHHGVEFFPFDLHHDAPLATGYHFKVDGVRFTLITDTGKTDATMLRLAARADVLFLEANYCVKMLSEGPYPAVLRDRISGDHGHLSNDQAVSFLDRLHGMKTIAPETVKVQQVYLVHLSENNNSPEQVRKALIPCQWTGPVRICGRDELVVGGESPSLPLGETDRA